jgi:hypothetical protein
MLFITRLLVACLLSVGITAATTAQAGNQMFEGSWSVKAFGNELTSGTAESSYYHFTGIPAGIQCNERWPRCPFQSTPTTGSGDFNVLGGDTVPATYCAPWANWGGGGATARPAKGATEFTMTNMGGTGNVPIPPLYRNHKFFTTATSMALPNHTLCTNKSTTGSGGWGKIMVGSPVVGTWSATTTGSQQGPFNFAAAPASGKAGMRMTGLAGEFQNVFPYIYSYTYATLRNATGTFAPGGGPGSFNITYTKGAVTSATIIVKAGGNQFGGTMQMLGALTTKVCYFRNGGCSLGGNNWRYDAVGASASTSLGVVTQGSLVTYKGYYYHTNLMQQSTVNVSGARFPWTTGSVTLRATGRGPHKTILDFSGYDNRDTATPTGKGTVQLVTPVLTRWTQPAVAFETGGVGILRIKFVPEPQTWAMLIAGASLLGVGYRMRGR